MIKKIEGLFGLNISATFIRAFGMGGKFLLVISMASTLSIEEVGKWGIVNNLILLLTFLLGFEVYTYYTPRIGKIDTLNNLKNIYENLIGLIISRTILFIVIYLLLLPLIDKLLFSLSLIVLFIVVSDSISQEINRILVAENRITLSNLILAIRSGVWCYFILIIWIVYDVFKNIESILLVWLIFSLFSLVIGILLEPNIYKIPQKPRFDKIKEMLRYAVPYFISSNLLRTAYFIDKIIILYLANEVILGVYTLFQSIYFAIISFMEAGIISKYFAIASRKINYSSNFNTIKIQTAEYIKRILLSSSVLVPSVYIALIFYFKRWGEPVYYDNKLALIIFVIAAVPFALSQLYQINLNILNQGLKNMKVRLISVTSYLISLIILCVITSNSVIAISSSLIVMAIIGLIAGVYYLRNALKLS